MYPFNFIWRWQKKELVFFCFPFYLKIFNKVYIECRRSSSPLGDVGAIGLQTMYNMYVIAANVSLGGVVTLVVTLGAIDSHIFTWVQLR